MTDLFNLIDLAINAVVQIGLGLMVSQAWIITLLSDNNVSFNDILGTLVQDFDWWCTRDLWTFSSTQHAAEYCPNGIVTESIFPFRNQ